MGRRKPDELGRIRIRQIHDMKAEIMTADHGKRAHYFEVYRLEDDVCAKCRRPRAEHPKRTP